MAAMPALALTLLLALLLAGCGGKVSTTPPPRDTGDASLPVQTSRIDLPIIADLDAIEKRLNSRVPRRVLALDRKEKVCISAARATLCLKHVRPCKGDACRQVPCKTGFKKAKVTPDISCRLVGHVDRGPIRISGAGDTLTFEMPVSAEVEARDIAGFIGTNEATGRAVVTAKMRLQLAPDWTPQPQIDISYRWTEVPGLLLAGKRFTFQKDADKALAKLIAQFEREAPALGRELHATEVIQRGWARAFTVIELNRENPAVWMRVTPRALGFGGYEVADREIRLRVGLEAGSETFVGIRPEPPQPTPLPPPAELGATGGFHLVIPVLADYHVIEGALEKALAKVAAQGITVDPVGKVDARFGRPTLYATRGGRLALGLPITVRGPFGLLDTSGTVWLTAAVFNKPNSQLLEIRDLRVSGEIAGVDGRLLLSIAQSPSVTAAIEQELATNFNRDFEKLMGKIGTALTDKRFGDFIFNARFEEIGNGVVRPLGDGAYLLVDARGTADLRWSPEPRPAKPAKAGKGRGR
jgi:hypothetical protein